ncbi:MAG: hypothetical protein WAU36_04200 [Cyclobacteriaceae bacterium]
MAARKEDIVEFVFNENRMKVEPGIYRVQMRDYSQAYGKKHPRPNSNTVHILTVKKDGKGVTCFLDHSLQGDPPERFEDFEILSRFEKEPVISKCMLTLSFEDSTGEKYEWKMADVWVLRNVLDFVCWLRKPFGYTTRTN